MAIQNESSLTSAINRPVDPFSMVSQISSAPNLQERGRMARRLEPDILREQSRAAEEKMRAEAEARKAQISKEQEIENRTFTGAEKALQDRQAAIGQRPERTITAFRPEKGLELATLTAVLGAFAGRISGQAGLRSIEGISEGFRLGQEDLYRREVANYEAELAQHRQKVTEAQQIYDNALKLGQLKRGAEMVELKKLEPLLQDSVITAHVKNNDVIKAGEAISAYRKAVDQAELKAIEAGMRPQPMRLTTIMGETEDGKKVALRVDVAAKGFVPPTAERPLRVGDPGVVGIEPEKAAQAGVRERSFALRTFTALRGVVQDFQNILQSPATSAMPALSGVIASDPNTVIGSLVALAARDMTSEDERAFQQLTEQIAASLARIEAQGLASGTTQANVRSFDALRPKAGDKAINMALYLARLKQEIDVGLEVFETNTGANEKQIEIVRRLRNEVDGLIPYTVEDVLKTLPGGKRTLSQSTQRLLNQTPIFETIEDRTPLSTPQEDMRQKMPREGDTSTSLSGRPIIFRNGNWEYQ
jgi:hypothetical protein